MADLLNTHESEFERSLGCEPGNYECSPDYDCDPCYDDECGPDDYEREKDDK